MEHPNGNGTNGGRFSPVLALLLENPAPNSRRTDTRIHRCIANGHAKFFEDFGVWKDSPILKGSTKFEPLPDVKNIMITGGAGFMYVAVAVPS